MTEVEKLYSLAGVEGEILRDCYDYYSSKGIDIWTVANCKDTDCKNCKYNKFIKHTPPFTAEKQLELIKILAKGEVKINNEDGEYEFSFFDTVSDFSSFEESLADLTNRIWQDLTGEERKQIKEILE